MCTGVMEDFTQRTVRSCAWSPDGRFLACASFDAMTTVWALTPSGDMEMVATLEGHENEVKGVAWSPSGDLLATCSRDKSVWLWEYDEEDGEFECAAVLHGHSQDVKAVAWHPARELLFSASYDDTVRAWGESPDEADWVCTQTLTGHSSTVWALAFEPSGDRFATVSDDRNMIVWRAAEPTAADAAQGVIDGLVWRREATIVGSHGRTTYSVSWSRPLPAQGAANASASNSDSVGGDGATDLTSTAGRSFIASCGADDSIRIFTERPAGDQGASVGSDATGADGGSASNSTGSSGSSAWMETACVEKAHTFDVNCVLWHPRDPSLLISCGDDCAVRLWRHSFSPQ